MAENDVTTLNNCDSAVAFELLQGRLSLCGHTWQIPLRPHWSEDPFDDQDWRRNYQSLTWLAPLRRRAISGDLNARQAWWWLAATWLKSLDRLVPGEATPWRADVASIRACELVAGLPVVGRQPWLLDAVITHLSWLDATAENSESFDARPLTVTARYACHLAVGDTERARELFAALADWRDEHFSPAGAPFPDSAEVSVSNAHVLATVESCLASVESQLPWNGHDQRLARSLEITQVKFAEKADATIRQGSYQWFRHFALDTDRAAYVGVSGARSGGGFLGFEDSRDGSAVDVSFAYGGRVWLRGPAPFDGATHDSQSKYSVQKSNNTFEIDLDRTYRDEYGQRHRLFHSIPSGVSVWESDIKKPFDLPSWFETSDAASDLTVTVSPSSIRLTSDDRTFFLMRLPVTDTRDEFMPSVGLSPSFRLYVGPWHARLIDVLHQAGPDSEHLTTERMSRLAGPLETDGDLLDVYAGGGWRIAANRTVLRAEQSRVPGAGRLVLSTPDGNHVVTGRGSRSKRGYLDIGDVPDGEYELQWAPVDGSPRRGPRLTLTTDIAVSSL